MVMLRIYDVSCRGRSLLLQFWGVMEERCCAVSDERVRREKKDRSRGWKTGTATAPAPEKYERTVKTLIQKRLEVYVLIDYTPREYVDACAKVVEGVIGIIRTNFDSGVIGIIHTVAHLAERVD